MIVHMYMSAFIIYMYVHLSLFLRMCVYVYIYIYICERAVSKNPENQGPAMCPQPPKATPTSLGSLRLGFRV